MPVAQEDRYSPDRATPSRFRPKGNFPAEALLGLELEVAGEWHDIETAVKTVDEEHDHLYIKTDGSIDGLEIVTQPMTLNWAKTYPFDDLLAELRARNVSSEDDGSGCDDDDCDCGSSQEYGLHVHVSRRAFHRKGRKSEAHQLAWLKFLHGNADALVRLARRQSNQWAAFREPLEGELERKATGDTYVDPTRYRAVNTTNTRTYELRFFGSTVNAQEMWAALEFADASVEYTRQLPDSSEMLEWDDWEKDDLLEWEAFITWCEEQGDKYKNLVAEVG